MQSGVGLLVSDVMSIYMIIDLNIVITMRFSINSQTVICYPSYAMCSREKPLVKRMAHRSTFIIYKNTEIPCYKFIFNFIFIIYLSTPMRFNPWAEGIDKHLVCVGCKYCLLCVQVLFTRLCVILLLD